MEGKGYEQFEVENLFNNACQEQKWSQQFEISADSDDHITLCLKIQYGLIQQANTVLSQGRFHTYRFLGLGKFQWFICICLYKSKHVHTNAYVWMPVYICTYAYAWTYINEMNRIYTHMHIHKCVHVCMHSMI